MAQYARPDNDTSDGRWLNNNGNNTNLYSYIDESSVDDSDYIHVTDSMGSTDTVVFRLSDVTDPEDHSSHSVVVRAKDAAGFGAVSLGVILKQGSTTIKSTTFSTGSSFANHTMSLSSGEAGNISDYTDLNLTITATDNMSFFTKTSVSWAYFECPDAAASTTTHPFLLFVD